MSEDDWPLLYRVTRLGHTAAPLLHESGVRRALHREWWRATSYSMLMAVDNDTWYGRPPAEQIAMLVSPAFVHSFARSLGLAPVEVGPAGVWTLRRTADASEAIALLVLAEGITPDRDRLEVMAASDLPIRTMWVNGADDPHAEWTHTRRAERSALWRQHWKGADARGKPADVTGTDGRAVPASHVGLADVRIWYSAQGRLAGSGIALAPMASDEARD